MKKRVCKVCGKTLAKLNRNKDLCFVHDPRYPQYRYVPVTKCTSFYQEAARPDPNNLIDVLLFGTEALNRNAFYRVLIFPDFTEMEEVTHEFLEDNGL